MTNLDLAERVISAFSSQLKTRKNFGHRHAAITMLWCQPSQPLLSPTRSLSSLVDLYPDPVRTAKPSRQPLPGLQEHCLASLCHNDDKPRASCAFASLVTLSKSGERLVLPTCPAGRSLHRCLAWPPIHNLAQKPSHLPAVVGCSL